MRLNVLVAVLAIAASLGGTATAASALPEPTPLDPAAQIGATRSRADVAKTLDPAAVTYYVRQYGVSAAVARERLIDQNVVAGLAGQLSLRAGNTLGRVAYDNAQGRWRVTATTSDGRARVQAALTEFGLGRASTVTEAIASNGEARASASRILDALERRGLLGYVSVAADGDQVHIDLDASASATRKQDVREAIEAGRGSVPATINERDIKAQPAVSCAFPYCDTLVAGTQWASSTVTCTLAFYTSPPKGSASTAPQMLTAGHCVNPNYGTQPWFTCRPTSCVGYTGIQGGRNFGPYDYGLLAVSDTSWPVYPGYWNWSVNGLSTVRKYYNYNSSVAQDNNAPVGLVVCKNGRSTGSTCGTISQNYAQANVGGTTTLRQLVVSNMCVVGGDSGSPVTAASSETAVGIVSAGNAVNNNTSCNSSPLTIAQPVGRALVDLGVQIYGYP